MQISVVIPMYNSKNVIVDALESVRKQTAVEHILEIIVVNDGSTDGSDVVVKEYIDREKVSYNIILLSQQNQGVSAARNAGMQKAKGEWIALLDSDDEWLPNKIQRQVEVIQQNPQIDILSASDTKGGLWILGKHLISLHKVKLWETLIKAFPPTSTMLFRRQVNEKLGGFNIYRHFGEDQEYWHRMICSYNFYYLPEHLEKFGHGKRGYGDSGLSGNMYKMFLGNIYNIRSLREREQISVLQYLFFSCFHVLKYLRRIIIVKMGL